MEYFEISSKIPRINEQSDAASSTDELQQLLLCQPPPLPAPMDCYDDGNGGKTCEIEPFHDEISFKLFSNDVIWRHLGYYLNFDDLKDCRLACGLFNKKILNVTNFKERAVLHILLSQLGRLELLLAKPETSSSWKNLAINVDRDPHDNDSENFWEASSSPSELDFLAPLLESVSSLKLYRSAEFRPPPIPKVRTTFSALFFLLKNVSKISVDVRIFQELDPSWFLASSVGFMSGIREFELECNPPTCVPEEVLRTGISLAMSAKHLQVLRIHSFVWRWDANRTRENASNRLDRVLRILRQNRTTLTHVQVEDPELWGNLCANRFGPFPLFPCLRVLKLQVSKKWLNECNLTKFLHSQPSHSFLQELELEFYGSIPSAVFEAIKVRARSGLKVLKVGTTKFKWSWMRKWDFLKETSLRDFTFNIRERSVRLDNDQLEEFFASFPKTATSLCLSGVKPLLEGQAHQFQVDISRFNPSILTRLQLRRCKGILRNTVLQEFWKELTNLIVLDLSNAGSSCTDWGFTGVPIGRAKQGLSISNLKGLRSLTLQNCVSITNRTLIEGIKFPELEFLDLTGNFQLTDAGYCAVMTQNPSLRTFWSERDHDADLKWRSVQALDRLRRTVPIGPRLTREYGLEYTNDYSESDWEKEAESDHEADDIWSVRYWRNSPPEQGNGADDDDDEELPDLDEDGDWLEKLLSKNNQNNSNRAHTDAFQAPGPSRNQQSVGEDRQCVAHSSSSGSSANDCHKMDADES